MNKTKTKELLCWEEPLLELNLGFKWITILSSKTYYKNNKPVKKTYHLFGWG